MSRRDRLTLALLLVMGASVISAAAVRVYRLATRTKLDDHAAWLIREAMRAP